MSVTRLGVHALKAYRPKNQKQQANTAPNWEISKMADCTPKSKLSPKTCMLYLHNLHIMPK